MRLLLDTHLLLWAAAGDARLPAEASRLILAPDTQPVFSAASLWEIVIKAGLGRDDFRVDARILRRGLLENGYEELAVTSEHAVAVSDLPDHHRDPFDRMLIAQARIEGLSLLTSDAAMARYGAPVTLV